jgi:hypothetical protein
MRIYSGDHTFMLEKAATGVGLMMCVKDYDELVFTVNTSDSTNATIKCQQGQGEYEPPAFGSAASKTNRWSYAQVIELNAMDFLNGDDGIVLTGTDINKTYKVNTSGVDWLNLHVSAYAAGKITIKGKGYSDSN